MQLAGVELCKIPCSKGDVFDATFLDLPAKRALMCVGARGGGARGGGHKCLRERRKFLQICNDYAAARAIGDVSRKNETSLGQGRSLTR